MEEVTSITRRGICDADQSGNGKSAGEFMEYQTTNRMRVRLTDAEDAAVTEAAEARGMRPSDLAREALLTYIGQPVRPPQSDTGTAALPGIDRLDQVAERLEALAAKAESHTMSTRIALDLAYGTENERKDVREALTDIAMSIGVLAGSIEPVGTDAPGAASDLIGSDIGRKTSAERQP